MRRPFVAGNWKMNKAIAEAADLAKAIYEGLPSEDTVDVAVIPPFLAIPKVVEVLKQSRIQVGAQDVFYEEKGAFTGEISPAMLQDAGCDFALVGHSERRHVIGESDLVIRKKLDALIESKLKVILCIGETIEERKANQTQHRLDIQVRAGLGGLPKEKMVNVTVAYEPVWAIGTGMTATPEQAEEAHAFVRNLLGDLFDEQVAQATRIQYGGSMNASNAAELMAKPNVDGGLIGGASLQADSFLKIITA